MSALASATSSIWSYFTAATYYFYLYTYIWGTAIVLGLYMLSPIIPYAGFAGRVVASVLSVIISSTYGIVVSTALRIAGKGGLSQWATGRCFKWVMRTSTGIKVAIEDPNDYLNKTRPAVFIGNHQSELDVLMLGCIFPRYCSVTAKINLRKMPFLGWFMRLSGTVFIDRANSANARQAMAGAAAEMTEKRQSVFMFPEGTRSYSAGPELLPFKKGAFHLAVQAGVPIVPVVVANYSDVLYGKELRFKSGTIYVKGMRVFFMILGSI